MIRRANEIRTRVVENVQGGKGKVTFQDWLIPAEDCPGHGRVISKVILEKGCSIGYHKHEGEFEAYVVIQGEGLLNDMGEETVLKTGDMHLCKDGDAHSIEGISDEPLVLSAVILDTLG